MRWQQVISQIDSMLNGTEENNHQYNFRKNFSFIEELRYMLYYLFSSWNIIRLTEQKITFIIQRNLGIWDVIEDNNRILLKSQSA